MRITAKKLWILAGAVLLCIIASLLITFAGLKVQTEEHEYQYYYTRYEDPSSLFAMEIINSSGDMTVASLDGSYLCIGEHELPADQKNAEFFFKLASQLPLDKKLDGASAKDPQYGLAESSAEVLIIDIQENPTCFEIGNPTPDGGGYYSCLYGDETVYILGSDIAECFLDSVAEFYDLSLYPELSGESLSALNSVEISGEKGNIVLKKEHSSEDGTTVYFRMNSPYDTILSSDQSKMIISLLNRIKGSDVANMGLDEFDKSFAASSRNYYILTFDGGIKYNIRAIYCANNALSYVNAEGSNYVYEIPTSLLAFAEYGPKDYVGSNLLELNTSVIDSLNIGKDSYRVDDSSGSYTVTKNGEQMDPKEFRNTVLSAVNHISVQEQYTNQIVGTELISISLLTKISQSPVELTFYESGSSKYVAAINGVPAFICGTTAVDTLLQL